MCISKVLREGVGEVNLNKITMVRNVIYKPIFLRYIIPELSGLYVIIEFTSIFFLLT